MNDDIASLREEYDGQSLDAADLGTDPMTAFAAWFDRARAAHDAGSSPEANAMCLATVAPDGTPSVRMVLLKDVDAERGGFTWFTNLASRKALELEGNEHGSLCWWWPGTPSRQVRAVGRVEPIGRDEAATYFATRPPEARAGAAASQQSRAIASRAQLDARVAAIDPAPIELPDDWGGFRLVADELEFWQGRHGRLHDRITFLRLDDRGEPRSAAAVTAAGGIDLLRAAGTVVDAPSGARWLRARLEP